MKGRTGHARAWLVLLCSALAAACGKSEDTQPDLDAPCTPGVISACSCSDGSMAMAGCLPSGMMATCPCPMPAGQGGSSASGAGGVSAAGTGGRIAAGSGGMSAAGAGGTSAAGASGAGASGAGGGGGMMSGGAGGSMPPPDGEWPAADPAGMGPFETVTENNVGPGSAYTLFRPMDLAQSGLLHPVITWGNGTGTTPQSYRGMLTQFASHGFIVIASNSENVAQGTPPPMLDGVTWVIEQNGDASSALYQHVDTMNIGATGHSQGAFATSTAGADERITTVAPIQGARAGTLHGPALLLCGGMDTIVPCSGSQSAFDRITVPVMYANLLAADHTMWVGSGFGGMRSPYFEVVTAWMRVHLMNDTALRPMFYGADCELCGDSAWDVMQKMMD